jgi:hypothetical protein
VTQPKEPHYFALHGQRPDFRGPGDAATINRVAVTERRAYLGLFPNDADYAALGEGSVSTLYYAQRAVDEIARINAEMRIVVILRKPADRAYSSFLYMRARGFEPCEDFLEALADEPRRREENWHHLWHYSRMSHYASDLDILRQRLGPKQVAVWFYDDLSDNYSGTVSSVLRFLDVPPDPAEGVGVPRVNVSGTPKHPLLRRTIAAATRNEVLRQAVKRSTSYRFRELIRRSTLTPADLPAEVERHFDGVFDADLARLSKMVSGDVPAWLRQPASQTGTSGQPAASTSTDPDAPQVHSW